MWRLWCPYLSLISPSFGASEGQCFVIVAFPGYLMKKWPELHAVKPSSLSGKNYRPQIVMKERSKLVIGAGNAIVQSIPLSSSFWTKNASCSHAKTYFTSLFHERKTFRSCVLGRYRFCIISNFRS